jgi:hypothetical protein
MHFSLRRGGCQEMGRGVGEERRRLVGRQVFHDRRRLGRRGRNTQVLPASQACHGEARIIVCKNRLTPAAGTLNTNRHETTPVAFIYRWKREGL